MSERNQLRINLFPNYQLQMDWESSPSIIDSKSHDFQSQLFKTFEAYPYEAFFQLAFYKADLLLPPTLRFWRFFAFHYVNTLRFSATVEFLRENETIFPDNGFFHNLLDEAPFFQGSEYLSEACLSFHWEGLHRHFQQRIASFHGTVEAFFQQYSSDIHLLGRVYFHLVENKNGSQPFAFMATYSSGTNVEGTYQHRPLQYALKEFEGHQDQLVKVLSTVYTAAEQSSFLKELLDSGELFFPLRFNPQESYRFLNEIPIYEDAGILCRIPNWWHQKSMGASVSVSFGDKKRTIIGFDTLLDFHSTLMLGDTPLSLDEAEDILRRSEGLAQIKGKWVVVNREKLRESIELWKRAQELTKNEEITLGEALRSLLIKPNNLLGELVSNTTVSVSFGTWLQSVLDKLKNPSIIQETKVPKDFRAILRPYQHVGFNWLILLDSLQLGSCLADDMGLGKTVQVLAFLNYIQKKKHYTTSLLVIPASLIHNWCAEIERFAPQLKIAVAHPSGGEKELGREILIGEVEPLDLVITTYGIMKRYEWIQEYSWNYIILDEAQAIKNPGTNLTKQVKALASKNRIALTGTPIENNLGDLWSLFDFINPGLLGSKSAFQTLVKNRSETEGENSLNKLRQVIRPYILRRLKSDKQIIADLPDKIELESYAPLSKSQYVLYKSEVNRLEALLESSEGGIERKGLVLATLMKFKQICNHPDQFLGNTAYDPKESGKFARLEEICETIREKREKVLVFTQFKEITSYLSTFLERVFGHAGLVLHGSVPVKKRKEMVQSFQSDVYVPFFILSLKAGGVGLNLAAANHVIHFDRWWNPAVENQATDRAFRIGQKKGVIVHKFITEGTVEEKIAAMLREKTELSENLFSDTSDASWITEMSNEELIHLFQLEGKQP